jgi:MFS family permease
MDGPFAVLLIATMSLYWESLEHRPTLLGSLAGIAACAAALLSYSVTVALLFCGIATCVRYAIAPQQRSNIVGAAFAAAIAFLGSHGLLWLVTGFDPIQTFLAATANHTRIMAGTRHETASRYFYLALSNWAVFFYAAGLPCSVVFWSGIWRTLSTWHQRPKTATQPATRESSDESTHVVLRHDAPTSFIMTAFLTLLIATLVPVYVLEVERVWMFLVPLVAIPAACCLFENERQTGRVQGTAAALILLAAQTIITEMLLTTYW